MSFSVMGDVHGHPDVVRGHLRDAGLIDDTDTWTGGSNVLWFVGDFTDRGPDGIGAIDLVMSLQRQAADAGGRVAALMGNHELMLLSVDTFGDSRIPGSRTTFHELWVANGGRRSDIDRLTDAHRSWIRSLPAMALEQDRLLVHADTAMYAEYGPTLDEVNSNVSAIVHGSDPDEWDRALEIFCDRNAFKRDERAARWMMQRFGGRRIVHGHTPIPLAAEVKPETVTVPLVYANGLCVNVDGGIFIGGPGFLHHETD